jgi:hypothetical protein
VQTGLRGCDRRKREAAVDEIVTHLFEVSRRRRSGAAHDYQRRDKKRTKAEESM